MPILATGIHRANQALGFTLIELVIVLVIVAISLGLILPNFNEDEAHRLQREAEETLLILESAADFSNASGKLIAWHVASDGSQFEALNTAGLWDPLEDSVLKPRALPKGLRWNIASGDSFNEARYVFVPGEPAPVIRMVIAGEHAHRTLQLDALAHGSLVND